MNNADNRRYTILLHMLVWVILLGFPYVLSRQSQELGMLIQHSWIPTAMYALVFYINYAYLVHKFFFTRKLLYFIVINLVLVAALVTVKQELIFNLFTEQSILLNDARPRPPKGLFVYIDIISLIVPIAFAVALSLANRWKKSEAIRNQAETEKLQSELKHLKYQLQPHFFFNALNNIYAMVEVSPQNAQKAIHNLSKLMRYFLYETNEEKVLLSKEIDFLNKFIELMKLRFTQNITVHTDFPEEIPQVMVAPLLFIAIVENAFKHGVSATTPSDITFKINCDNNRINFTSINKNFPKNIDDISGSGIGLENLKKRLDLIYPNAYQLGTEIDDHNYYKITLSIKY